MSTVTHPEVDVVVMGLGATGGAVAAQLATAGHSVVGLEKGPYWDHTNDMAPERIHDDWAMSYDAKFDNPCSYNTFTLRNNDGQFALPGRRPGIVFAMGHGVGGMQLHWQANVGRAGPWTFAPYSNTLSRYGPGAAETMFIPNWDLIDWPAPYANYEPYYAAFEQSAGFSGINDGPFTPMATNYQTPPHPTTPDGAAWSTAAEALGYHPYPGPSGICSAPYINQYGIARNACVYCGFCNECETGAKCNSGVSTVPAAVNSGNFDMRLFSYVFRIDLNTAGTAATDVAYYDGFGTVHIQPAKAIFSGLWGWNTLRLMANSGLGNLYNSTTATGSLGRYVCGYGAAPGTATGTLDIGQATYHAGNSGGGSTRCQDYQEDNFDHTGLNFIGGGDFQAGGYGGASGSALGLGPTTSASFGSTVKAGIKNGQIKKTVTISRDTGGPGGCRMPLTTHHVDLDPHYTDAFGDPLARATIDTDINRIRAGNYIAPFYATILTKMGCTNVVTTKVDETKIAGTNQTWGSHYRGGVHVGLNDATSVLNLWNQSWQVQNFFNAGENAEPFGSTQSPGTHSAGMNAYVAADGIKQYLASPGPLATSSSSSYQDGT